MGGAQWRGFQSLAGLDEVSWRVFWGSFEVSLGGMVVVCWCVVVVKEEFKLLGARGCGP